LINAQTWLTRELTIILMNENMPTLFVCVQLSLGFFKHAIGNKMAIEWSF